MSDALVRVKNLEVNYGGEFNLKIKELNIRREETLTLIGPNGSGKSTLLRMLSLLSPPKGGDIYFDGERIGSSSRQLLRLRRRMAAVLQEPLLCRMTVYRNVALGLRFRRTPKNEMHERVMEWLARMRIDHLKDRQAKQLSGGEAQRTSIARAMVLNPDLLLLDEPFSALDPPTRSALIEEFQQILADTRTTTIFATHDRGEAMALSDRIAVIQGGRLAQWGSAEEVFTQPRTEEVAKFVGAATLIPGKVTQDRGGVLHIEGESCALEVAGPGHLGETVLVCVRPEDVTLSNVGALAPSSARNCLRGVVTRVLPSDGGFRIVADCGVPVVASITRSAFAELGLEPGHPVAATFKATAAHIIRRSDSETEA